MDVQYIADRNAYRSNGDQVIVLPELLADAIFAPQPSQDGEASEDQKEPRRDVDFVWDGDFGVSRAVVGLPFFDLGAHSIAVESGREGDLRRKKS